MTTEEKRVYNNGLLLGAVSKGVIVRTITEQSGGGASMTPYYVVPQKEQAIPLVGYNIACEFYDIVL